MCSSLISPISLLRILPDLQQESALLDLAKPGITLHPCL
jgi:hypothetical protein